MTNMFTDVTGQVERLIRRAATDILLPNFRHLTPDQIRYKSPKDVVTDADEKAEKFLSAGLLEILPSAVVIGEENCHKDPDCLKHLATAEWAWLVDPIDGTNNFIRHSDDFGVMVALVHNGQPYAGWVYLPMYDIMISGNDENGVFRNGKEIGITPTYNRSLDQLCGLYRTRDKDISARMEIFPIRHDTHCNAFDYNVLISGDSDFIVYPGSNPWDIVAGSILIQALGGCAAKADGSRIEYDALENNLPFLATRCVSDWPKVAKALYPALQPPET